MDDSQFDVLTLKSSKQISARPQGDMDGFRSPRPARRDSSSSGSGAPPTSRYSDESSMRSTYVDMEDRELAHALKRIEKLSAEIRANEDVEANVRSLRDRIEMARRNAAVTIAKLNDKMDAIEQAWDDQIIQEQKDIAKEVLSILGSMKEGELSQALTFRKKRSSRGRNRNANSSARGSRSGSGESRSSESSATAASPALSSGSSVHSSSMSKKIAHLDRKEREFAGRAVDVKKDARQIDAMSRNLDTINELERVVCNKLGRLQSVGDAKPGSAVYGTVELVDNYRATVESLANAIRALNNVSCLPSITNDDPITKSEIDKVCGAMTAFLGRIKAQLGSNPGSNETTGILRPQTSVRVAGSKGSARQTAASSATSSTASGGASTASAESGASSGASYESALGAPSSASGGSASSTTNASTAASIESHRG